MLNDIQVHDHNLFTVIMYNYIYTYTYMCAGKIVEENTPKRQ